jgi:hypothetical protein
MLSQHEKEIKAEHFSQLFNTLLPGMNVVPIYVVPKPPEDKLHLVVDHSAGPYSLNSMIDCQSIAGVKLDGIKSFSDSIRKFHALHPGDVQSEDFLMLWKSDIAAAY